MEADPSSPAGSSPSLTLEDAGLAVFWMIGLGLFCSLAVTATDWPESTRGMAGALAVEAGLVLGAVLVLRRKRLPWTTLTGPVMNRWRRAALIGLAGCLVLLPVSLALSLASQTILGWFNAQADEQPPLRWLVERHDLFFRLVFLFQAVVAAPLSEELFFRGLLLRSLLTRFSTAGAVVISSLLFALFHFHGPAFLPLFALAVGFALACLRAGSLAAAWVMHAAYNIVNLAWHLTAKG